ncbi:Ig-like domain-containing protein [Paenibacillus glycinis]|uniref:Ig-like domain-containing protein n=1 Tax=Paenibacillus glycinis TaxID=2697035 RepID=UPI001F304077
MFRKKVKKSVMIMVILALGVSSALFDARAGLALALGTTLSELSASSTSSTYGDEVTYMAAVDDAANEGTPPSGTVTFMDGEKVLSAAALVKPEPKITIATTSVSIPDGTTNNCVTGPDSYEYAPCPVVQWGQYIPIELSVIAITIMRWTLSHTMPPATLLNNGSSRELGICGRLR